MVDYVGTSLADFQHHPGGNAMIFEMFGRAARGCYLKSQFLENPRYGHDFILMIIMHADKHCTRQGHLETGRHLRFGESKPEGMIDAHNFAGRFHFRSQQAVYIGEAVKRKDGFFHGNMRGYHPFGKSQPGKSFAQHHFCGQFGQRYADGFADKGNGAGGPGIYFQNI